MYRIHWIENYATGYILFLPVEGDELQPRGHDPLDELAELLEQVLALHAVLLAQLVDRPTQNIRLIKH